jgi:hypothetical protein
MRRNDYWQHPENQAMVQRIRDAGADGRTLTTGEQNFMTHELTEIDLRQLGFGEGEAHSIALTTHPLYMNYDPAVIKQFPEAFNSDWFDAWNIEE